MPCYHPLRGYRAQSPNPSGKYSIAFNVQEGFRDLPVDLPCGQCIGCRLERSRAWAIRCVHEAQLYEDNCFITLTYADENLPKGKTLVKKHFQDFMKRLRVKYNPRPVKYGPNPLPRKIRFFHCGEYGEKYRRPHYHACIFNLDFADKTFWKEVNGEKYFVSEELKELWPHGHSMLGEVTFESAAYVARYITKKITGKNSAEHYKVTDRKGNIHVLQPEYVTMSRRPGIGKAWYEKFRSDVYPSDFIVIRGKKMKPPKFYDQQLELEYPSDFARLKARREVQGEKHVDNNTWERLQVREEIHVAKYRKLIRKYENET